MDTALRTSSMRKALDDRDNIIEILMNISTVLGDGIEKAIAYAENAEDFSIDELLAILTASTDRSKRVPLLRRAGGGMMSRKKILYPRIGKQTKLPNATRLCKICGQNLSDIQLSVQVNASREDDEPHNVHSRCIIGVSEFTVLTKLGYKPPQPEFA